MPRTRLLDRPLYHLSFEGKPSECEIERDAARLMLPQEYSRRPSQLKHVGDSRLETEASPRMKETLDIVVVR